MNVRGRVKVCRFCEDKAVTINYKDDRQLRRFVTERGKVIPRSCLLYTSPSPRD